MACADVVDEIKVCGERERKSVSVTFSMVGTFDAGEKRAVSEGIMLVIIAFTSFSLFLFRPALLLETIDPFAFTEEYVRF